MKKVMIDGKTVKVKDDLYEYAKSDLIDLSDKRYYRYFIETYYTTGSIEDGTIKRVNVDEILKNISEDELSEVINETLRKRKNQFA